MFAKSFTDDIKDIDLLLGSEACNYLSCDDKAKVHLGKTAANAQAPYLA